MQDRKHDEERQRCVNEDLIALSRWSIKPEEEDKQLGNDSCGKLKQISF
jgi:hypothetical protein